MAGDMMMMMICRHMIGNQATLDRVEEQYLLVNNYWIFVTALNSWQPKSLIVALAMPEIWGELENFEGAKEPCPVTCNTIFSCLQKKFICCQYQDAVKKYLEVQVL